MGTVLDELAAFEHQHPVGGFGSEHAGAVGNFVFADGSVHTLSANIDPQVFQYLGNRADGELISATKFSR